MDDLKKIQIIIKETSDYFEIKPEYLALKTRKRDFIEPKQIAQKMAKEFTKLSLNKIGNDIGGVGYATVLNSFKRFNNLYDTESEYRIKADTIFRRIELRIIGANQKIVSEMKARKYRPKSNKIIIKTFAKNHGYRQQR